MPTEDAALVAWVQDAEQVREFLNCVRAFVVTFGPTETEMATKFLAMLAHRDAQLAAAKRVRDKAVGHLLQCDADLEAAERQLVAVRTLVDQQAEDPGLWFQAATAPEAYLQQELRRLHERVESKTLADPPRVAPVDRLTPDQRKSVEMARADHIQEHGLTKAFARGDRERLLAILDQHCPRPPVHVPCMDCDTFDCTEDDGAPCTCVCHPKPRPRPEPASSLPTQQCANRLPHEAHAIEFAPTLTKCPGVRPRPEPAGETP